MSPEALFHVVREAQVLHVAEWPALVAFAAALAVHVGAIEALHHGWGAPPRHGWWRPFLVFFVVALGAGAMLAAAPLGAAAWGLSRHGAVWLEQSPATNAFAPLVALGATLAVEAVGVAALSAAWAARTRWSGVGRALLLGGLLGLLPLAVQVGAIVYAGPVPTLILASPDRVHVGRTVPIVTAAAAPERWELLAHDPWTPEEAGTTRVALAAERGALSVASVATIEAGDEIGHPGFPLRVGQRIAYGDYSRHETTRVLIWGGGMESSLDETQLTILAVAGVDEAGPLRTFRVVVRHPGGEVRERRVYAWNGEVIEIVGEEHRAFATDDVFAPFDGHSCEWNDETPGPSSCVQHHDGGAVSSVVRVAVLIFSIGLVDVGEGDSTTGWTKVGYEPGPPNAPFAPVAGEKPAPGE